LEFMSRKFKQDVQDNQDDSSRFAVILLCCFDLDFD